jgi:16S rRNA (adenine1518-N6/adenine1519-N6)-dimethyltransferase
MVGRRPGPLHDLRPTQPETVDVIGNLPYYITSDIVLRILELHQNIERAVIMVQSEVADRIAAAPGSRDYGLLSATVQLFARVDKLFTLPPGAFSPPPQVHSSALRLTMAPRLQELQVDEGPFIAFLKLAFAHKRKTLLNNLRSQYQDVAIRAALKSAGLRADARAEAMSLEKTAAVFRALRQA